jgi:hypothetical protein
MAWSCKHSDLPSDSGTTISLFVCLLSEILSNMII